MEMKMNCSHPVIYHIDGHLKCIECGAVLDAPAEPVKENEKADDGGEPEKDTAAEAGAEKAEETEKPSAGEKKAGKSAKK